MTRCMCASLLATVGLLTSLPAQVPAPNASSVPLTQQPVRPGATATAGDSKVKQALAQAQEKIQKQAWPEASSLLQSVLDAPEEILPRAVPGLAAKTPFPASSSWAEAQRLLKELPADRRKQYERQIEARAAAQLTGAVLGGSESGVSRVAQRYRPTAAGQAAYAWLQQHLDRQLKVHPAAGPGDWPLFGGNASRSGRIPDGDVPFLEPTWRKSMVTEGTTAAEWVAEAERTAPALTLPAFFPIACGGAAYYRTRAGVQCCSAVSGEVLWHSYALVSLEALVNRDTGKRIKVTEWYHLYKQSGVPILFENSVLGTLSADREHVYIVDGVAVPPHPSLWNQARGQGQQEPFLGLLNDAAKESSLVAIDRESGKVVWQLGGRFDSGILRGSYFLGPPLPLGGRLYVLTEKDGMLRLACLDPPRADRHWPRVAWVKDLFKPPDSLLADAARRMQAVHLAYADGILVIPTHAGTIVGVDVLTQGIAWAWNYREARPPNNAFGRPGRPPQRSPLRLPDGSASPARLSEWKTSAPVIQDGKVVFAAPDAASLFCVSLRDGSLQWRVPRNDDLYLAGVWDDRVLVVGRTACRALRLADGKPLWRLETGLPSGQGVLAGKHYYLPIAADALHKQAGVWVLDLAKGQPITFCRARPGDTPGNVLFHKGQLISQTASSVTAYPILKRRLEQAEEELKKDARHVEPLRRRAELRWAGSNFAGAVEDFRAALALQPQPPLATELREDLYEALTKLLEHDFAAGEKYLDEYRKITQIAVPAEANDPERVRLAREQQRRQARLHSLLAQGLDQQGRVVEALRAYLDYSVLAQRAELIRIPDDPNLAVQPDVWLQGRIAALAARASPVQRQAIADEVASRWRALSGREVADMRRFVAVFGPAFRPDAEAHLALAERLSQEGAACEAELLLLRLERGSTDSTVQARALEALARHWARRGLLEDAAQLYRRLGRDHAVTAVRDGLTGAELFREAATDRRLLPYLDDPVPDIPAGKLKVVELPGEPAARTQLALDFVGDLPPFFRKYRFVLQYQRGLGFRLALVERTSGEEVWSEVLKSADRLGPLADSPGLRLRVHVQGHLAILGVGDVVYAFDLAGRKKLWERNWIKPSALTLGQRVLQDDEGRVLVYDSSQQSPEDFGRLGPVSTSCVCLLTPTGLQALDPLTGNVVWERAGVPLHHHVFGDDRHVAVVEMTPDGKPVGTRLFRAGDGSRVDAPDFADAYADRLCARGCQLLFRETDSAGKFTLRLRDVTTGKDLWQQGFPARSRVLRSEDPDLVAVLEMDGSLAIFDIRSRTLLLRSRLEGINVYQVESGLLLADDTRVFVVLNKAGENKPATSGSAASVFTLRSIGVDGWIAALDRNGKQLWRSNEPLLHQVLLVDQFHELPMLLLAARSSKVSPGDKAPKMTVTTTIRSLAKDTGEVVHTKEITSQSVQPVFHTLAIRHGGRRIEVVGPNLRLRYLRDGEGGEGLPDM